ncbi:MAG TPA: hypothetical protein VFB00_07865 [Terriglobales bacterium]|nr:hypothetical protein [Terriglobales bacterium]
MRRNREEHPREVMPTINDHDESPAILHLIEQLDRDLKESEGKASKAQ